MTDSRDHSTNAELDGTLTLGLIHGGGTGAELIACVRRVVSTIEDATDQRFRIEEFDNDRWADQFDEEVYDADLHADLLDFYDRIQKQKGVLVRGSLPAPVLYRLRRDLEQAVKMVPLNPFPAVSRFPGFGVTLLRESIHGLYHHDDMRREGDVVGARVEWHEKTLRFLAREAFRLAEHHEPRCVTTILKTSVLGELGDLWLDTFREESRRHPSVRYRHRPSGAGFSDMWMSPEEYGVVVTDDAAGDILADLIPTILYESRNLVSAGNLSPMGHASFQTDHGTIRPLVGKDAVNPVAMIGAMAMALDHGLSGSDLAREITLAVDDVLSKGARTQDFHTGPAQERVGTTEMTDRILERLHACLVTKK